MTAVPAAPMLTIGQLAAHAGVTVRAVRHYHRRGLLAEPARDRSGYRRYGADAVIALIRIRTLADAGVPLARIDELMRADAVEFARAVTQIDTALEARIAQLSRHRERIAQLADGDRLFLPDDVVAVLDDLRALGVSERSVRIERDAWVIMAALGGDLVAGWVGEKRAALADPEFRRIQLACDEVVDLDPDDPRVAELADVAVAWTARQPPVDGPAEPSAATLAAATLVNAHIARASPALQRLFELAAQRAAGPPA